MKSVVGSRLTVSLDVTLSFSVSLKVLCWRRHGMLLFVLKPQKTQLRLTSSPEPFRGKARTGMAWGYWVRTIRNEKLSCLQPNTHEQMKKKATKILPQLEHKNYTERLIACKLPTLHFRRIRGDMIETYKILSGKYDRSATPTLPVAGPAVTRGHNLRLHKFRARCDLRKYYFTNRVVNIWNSLPSYVISAETVNCFKSRLDNFWKN